MSPKPDRPHTSDKELDEDELSRITSNTNYNLGELEQHKRTHEESVKDGADDPAPGSAKAPKLDTAAFAAKVSANMEKASHTATAHNWTDSADITKETDKVSHAAGKVLAALQVDPGTLKAIGESAKATAEYVARLRTIVKERQEMDSGASRSANQGDGVPGLLDYLAKLSVGLKSGKVYMLLPDHLAGHMVKEGTLPGKKNQWSRERASATAYNDLAQLTEKFEYACKEEIGDVPPGKTILVWAQSPAWLTSTPSKAATNTMITYWWKRITTGLPENQANDGGAIHVHFIFEDPAKSSEGLSNRQPNLDKLKGLMNVETTKTPSLSFRTWGVWEAEKWIKDGHNPAAKATTEKAQEPDLVLDDGAAIAEEAPKLDLVQDNGTATSKAAICLVRYLSASLLNDDKACKDICAECGGTCSKECGTRHAKKKLDNERSYRDVAAGGKKEADQAESSTKDKVTHCP